MLSEEQKRDYNFLDAKDKVKDNLVKDVDFINDATEFLEKRENYSIRDLNTPQSI